MTLGTQIRRWKTRTGRNADELARLVGCKRRIVFDWQADRGVPSSAFRPRLLEVLGIDDEEFVRAVNATLEVMHAASEPLAEAPLPNLDQICERLEVWRSRVVESRLPVGVAAVLHTLPFYMRINGEIRVTAAQLEDDTGWRDVETLLEAAIRSPLITVVRAGVYRLA